MLVNEKTVFIINPIAGTNHKQVILDAINQAFHIDTYELFFSEFSGHANEIAVSKAADGYVDFVAVGGDGTVNEVASALAGTSCNLGIIPVGSGNGLARHLRIPLTLKESLEVIKHRHIKTIDVGKANGQYFFCTCGIGFDASVGKKFMDERKRGMINYVRAAFHQYINYSPKSYTLKTDNKKIDLDAFLVTFANSSQFGNNAYIAPHAVIDDGLLDLCILRPFPKTSTIELGLRLFFKNIDQSPYLEVIKIQKASLKRKGKKKMIVHLDGEPMIIKKKLKIKIIPGALNIMVPENSRKKGPVLKLKKIPGII